MKELSELLDGEIKERFDHIVKLGFKVDEVEKWKLKTPSEDANYTLGFIDGLYMAKEKIVS